MASVLTKAKHDYVSARFQRLSLALRDHFVFLNALCQFKSAQHRVLLLVYDLVGALVDAVIFIVKARSDHFVW